MGGPLVDSSAKGVSSSICLCHSTCEKAGFEHSSCACSENETFEAGIAGGQDDFAVKEIGTALADVMHVYDDSNDDEGTDPGEDTDENDDLLLSLESDLTDDLVDIDTEVVTSPAFPGGDASESSTGKSDPENSSTNGTPVLVSAMKGSRAKRGIVTRLSVSWSSDVYDPPVTSESHTVRVHQRGSRKGHYKYKSSKSISSSRSTNGSKKDKKHSRHSSSSKRDGLPAPTRPHWRRRRTSPTQPKSNMSASDLPDELWAHILELGAVSSTLGFRDLCCLAIASRRLRRLSLHPSLWSALLSRDFPSQSQPQPQPPSSSSTSSLQQELHPKSLYKTKFERHKVLTAEISRAVSALLKTLGRDKSEGRRVFLRI